VVDHTSLALFDQIPDQYITAARGLRMLFSDRSVGSDIDNALNCLAAPSWSDSPSYCRNDYNSAGDPELYTAADLTNGTVPDLVLFPANSTTYNRSNWTYVYQQGEWEWLTENFITSLAPQYLPTKDVLTYQFSYLNVLPGSTIENSDIGFFANTSRTDIGDLEAFIAQHPDKEFIFWTTSLARSIGNQESTDFNNQMRRYAIENDKILFDMADIISHDRNGQPCYDNRDGVPYVHPVTGASENYPDDGINYPAICRDYTTDVDGGHLGSVSGGMITMAKAYWVLMARIAGWNP
jgi:hypothetical protein